MSMHRTGWLAYVVIGWVALAPASAALVLESPQISHSVAVVGEPVTVTANLKNTSGTAYDSITVALFLPAGWQSEPVQLQLPSLAPYTDQAVRFRCVATADGHGAGKLLVQSPALPEPLSATFPLASVKPLEVLPTRRSMHYAGMATEAAGGTIYITSGAYIVFLPTCGEDRGPGLVYSQDGDRWNRVATLPCLGRVIYRDGPASAPRTVERWVFPKTFWLPVDPNNLRDYLLTFKDYWKDERGRWWMAKAWFGPTTDTRVIKMTCALWCSGDAEVLRFEGPILTVGDGTFGASRADYATPDGKPTSHDAVLARYDRVDRGVMAIERPGGGVIGMLWDPAQLWVAGKDTPQALFSSPNQLLGRSNHWLSLVVPHFAAGQGPAAARAPELRLPAKRPIYLRSELFVTSSGGVADAVAAAKTRFAPGGDGYATLPDLSDPK